MSRICVCNTSRSLKENLEVAEQQGFIVMMGGETDKKRFILNQYYDLCHAKLLPMVSVMLREDGGEVKYDLITTDRRSGFHMDCRSLETELDSVYESMEEDVSKTLKTKFLKAKKYDVGHTLGVAAFPDDDWRILNCIMKYVCLATKQYNKLSLQYDIYWSLNRSKIG